MEAPCLSVPVRSGIPKATAVLLLGPHDTGKDIDADEREMLEKLAARAAAGYERVFARLLREQVAQLKTEVVALQNGVKTEPATCKQDWLLSNSRRSLIANPGKDQLPRRQFAKYFTAVGIAAAFGGLLIFIHARKNSYPVKVVAHAGDVPIGGVKIISYPNDEHPCFLLHPSDETFLAFSRLCTHAACPTFYRPEEHVFACPCHGGVFSAVDGSVLDGPPPKPLPRVRLELRGQDLVATGLI